MCVGGLRCKRCGGVDYAKSGTARGHQRSRCRGCGCHVTDTPLRGKPPAMKALAILLHGMGGMSFSMIGRVLGVSNGAVLKWVRAEAALLPEPVVSPSVVTVEVDEMWHFLKRNLPSSGSGVPVTWMHGAPWPLRWLRHRLLRRRIAERRWCWGA